jgi:hypothetical protein
MKLTHDHFPAVMIREGGPPRLAAVARDEDVDVPPSRIMTSVGAVFADPVSESEAQAGGPSQIHMFNERHPLAQTQAVILLFSQYKVKQIL